MTPTNIYYAYEIKRLTEQMSRVADCVLFAQHSDMIGACKLLLTENMCEAVTALTANLNAYVEELEKSDD